MQSSRYVFQVSFTEREYRQLMPLLLQMKRLTGMSRSRLIKRMIAHYASGMLKAIV